MRKLVLESLSSPKLANLATVLYLKTKSTDGELLSKVDKFLRERFIYEHEAIETLQHPNYMLSSLEISGKLIGDCDDISTLHAALLVALGFQVRFVAIRSLRDSIDFDHVYIEVNNNGEWIMYDITLPLGTHIEYFGRIAIQV